MTRIEFQKFFQKCQARQYAIMLKKNSDYCKGLAHDDPFANFRQVEKFGICGAEIGLLTRMSDKFARIITFAKGISLKVTDETVDDTILDFCNYMLLFLGYVVEKRERLAKANELRPKPKRKRAQAKSTALRELSPDEQAEAIKQHHRIIGRTDAHPTGMTQ